MMRLQPNSLTLVKVSANEIPQILQKEVVSVLDCGRPSLRWVKIPGEAVPLEIVDEEVQILRRFV
jgi:hypothetical protein